MKKIFPLLLFYVCFLEAMEKQNNLCPFAELPTDLQNLIVTRYGIERSDLVHTVKNRRLVCKTFYAMLSGQQAIEKLAKIWSVQCNTGYPFLLRRLKLYQAHQSYLAWKQQAEEPNQMALLHQILLQSLPSYQREAQVVLRNQYSDLKDIAKPLVFYKHLDYIQLPDGSFFSLFYLDQMEVMVKYNGDGTHDARVYPVVIQWSRGGSQYTASGVLENHIYLYDQIDAVNTWPMQVDRVVSIKHEYDFYGNLVNASVNSFPSAQM